MTFLYYTSSILGAHTVTKCSEIGTFASNWDMGAADSAISFGLRNYPIWKMWARPINFFFGFDENVAPDWTGKLGTWKWNETMP